MYQTGTHGSVGGRLANQSSASYPILKAGYYRHFTSFTQFLISADIAYDPSDKFKDHFTFRLPHCFSILL